MMQVRLLGPVDVVAEGGEPQRIAGQRRRGLLAVLAVHAGEVVSSDELRGAVWPRCPPDNVANTMQSHMSGLRTLLRSRSAILARPPGYVLDLGDDGTDVLVAERLLRLAEKSGSPAEAAEHLREALALWRGRPLGDLTARLGWFEVPARRLEQLALQAQTLLVESRLAQGQHAQLIPELEVLTAEHPLHEVLWGQLMVALYRAGRQTDALAAFQQIRGLLLDEHGVDPGGQLQKLQAAVLRHDPGLLAPTTATAVSGGAAPQAAPVPVPAQLPLVVPSFTGRQAELAELDRLVPGAAAAGEGAQPLPVCLVSGPAGVGKTALAVHWAHRAAARFPDGQLYVNLRGFDPAGAPVEPAEAVRGFLDAFAVPPTHISASLDAQIARYRSLVAGKRILIVLDNASDLEQVRPLLPGTPGCLVLITSRHQLTGLIATCLVRPLTLGLLDPGEAEAMLTRRLGAGRAAAEPAAVAEIIDRCARLPLALAIVAARAATRAGFSLAALAADLRGADLDAFRTGDTSADIRAVFSWSYQKLDPGAARLFRLLGLHPGPDISAPAAASLAEVPAHQARRLLADLARVHLLTEDTPGRYAFHDLLRAYAAELARVHDDGQQRQAAVRRMLDHYLHTAHGAALRLKPERHRIELAQLPPGIVIEDLPTADRALAWFAAEHRVLLACVGQAAAYGLDRHAWQLAWATKTYLLRQGYWHEEIAAHRAAAEAARRSGDLNGLGHALLGLAEASVRLNRIDEAGARFRAAREAFAEAGDLRGAADAWLGLNEISELRGFPAEAIGNSQQALDLFRRVGDPAGQAAALNSLGWLHAQVGEHQQALASCQEALALMQDLGFRGGEAATWDSLGYIHRQLGSHQASIDCYQHAISIYRQQADRFNEADTLSSLGDALADSGDDAAARQAWQLALRIFNQISHPGADQVRAKLETA